MVPYNSLNQVCIQVSQQKSKQLWKIYDYFFYEGGVHN